MTSDYTVSVLKRYAIEERLDIFHRLMEILGEKAPNPSIFWENAARVINTHMEEIRTRTPGELTTKVERKLAGLAKLARPADDRIYFHRIGNEVCIG